jgi:hypothetical protein
LTALGDAAGGRIRVDARAESEENVGCRDELIVASLGIAELQQ